MYFLYSNCSIGTMLNCLTTPEGIEYLPNLDKIMTGI